MKAAIAMTITATTTMPIANSAPPILPSISPHRPMMVQIPMIPSNTCRQDALLFILL